MNARALLEAFRADLAAAADPASLDEIRRTHTGKKSPIKAAFKGLRDLDPSERGAAAAALNAAQATIETELKAATETIATRALSARLDAEWIDLTLPGVALPRGARHPISEVEARCMAVLMPIDWHQCWSFSTVSR